MPSYCPPCWPSKALTDFDDPEPALVQVPNHDSVNPEKDGDTLTKPPTEYGGEAAKQFLDALEAVADQIPVPGVGTAVKIAKNIMQACDESHATLERAEGLKLRIKKLVTILVDELKEKKADEIEDKLQQDIKLLSTDLEYIQEKLKDIGSQHALLSVVFRGLNEDKVKKCVGRLENSLENFRLTRQINDTKLFNTLEKQILAFRTTLDDMKGKVDHMHTTLDDVKAILEERLPVTGSSSRPRSRAAIPANGSIFHGRDPLVAQLVRILTSNSGGQKRPRVCLLGPGGTGKTPTALAVMADDEMRKCFPEQNQVWVPCVKATSVSLFLDTLYSSLGTKQNTDDTLKDIISGIRSSSQPLVVLLDNFETPWNVLDSRREIQQILNEIDQIVDVTLFITMRSSFPPGNKQWESFDIEAVNEEAARQIYLDICSAGSDDHQLSVLLQALGHMPLAITLMANTARLSGLGASELMKEYQRIGTTMLGHGPNGEHSLDVCISLSVDSQPVQEHPEAYELLTTLAMLPVGTSYQALSKWWARDSPNLMGALQALAETSLIKRRDTHYFVLPVIRSYILDPSRLHMKVRNAMIASACNFLAQHNSSPGEATFKEHADVLSAEEGNLQAILLGIIDPEPSLIEALLVLARHQLSTRPRLEVIEHALKLARQLKRHQSLIGDVLTCHGRILLRLDHYDQAVETFKLASKTFTSIPDKKQAALCSLDLVAVYRLTDTPSTTQLRLVEDAKAVFEKLDDAQGVALSLYSLGTIYGQNGYHSEGIEFLTRAMLMFQHLGDAMNQAKCTYYLEQIYYWDRRYDDALIAGTAAVQEYEQLGQYSGDPMRTLGRTLLMQGNYQGALETLVRTLTIDKAYGSPLSIGQTLEVIGRTWAKMDQIADAQGAYAEAMQYFGAMKGFEAEQALIRCRFLTRQAENCREPILGSYLGGKSCASRVPQRFLMYFHAE